MNDRIYVGSLISEPHLYHHGILGMRWGVRRFQKKDGSLTSAGKSRYGVKGGKNSKTELESKRKGLSKGQKAAIALVAAGLTAYGGYKLAQSGKLDGFINRGSKALSTDELKALGISVVEPTRIELNRIEPTRIDLSSGGSSEVKGIKSLSHSETSKESESKVNPFFSPVDPDFYTNCGNCAIALEARQRGLDAMALGNSKGMTISQMGSFFKNLKSENVSDLRVNTPNVSDAEYLSAYKRGGGAGIESFYRDRGQKIKDEISNQITSAHPPGSRGCLFVPMETSSHWVSWEVDKKGSVNFYNSQEPDRNLVTTCFGHYTYHKNDSKVALTAIRYDNLDFADNVNEVIGQSSKKPRYQTFDQSVEKGSSFVLQYKRS